jgi:hypothetical protein
MAPLAAVTARAALVAGSKICNTIRSGRMTK